MWHICFWTSVAFVVLSLILCLIRGKGKTFSTLAVGVYMAVFCVYVPVWCEMTVPGAWGKQQSFLLSGISAMHAFTKGGDFKVIAGAACPENLYNAYSVWATVLIAVAPFFTIGFLLSMFKNVSAFFAYLRAWFRDLYVFTSLNDRSLALAADIKKKEPKAAVIFTDVSEKGEKGAGLAARAGKLGAICFRKDIRGVNLNRHGKKTAITFFAIGEDESRNLDQAIYLIEQYRDRENTHIYLFSKSAESQLILSAADLGKVKVRRVDEVRSLINRVLFEQGQMLFERAKEADDGSKHICAVVVGMGKHGTEMVKALAWYGQMDGYTLEIHAFDRDPAAREHFEALAPELMSEKYNGVCVPGEAQYKITVHGGVDVKTRAFAEALEKLPQTTYVLVALGSDGPNVEAAVDMRMYFERMKCHPVIQAIVYNARQAGALKGIKNYRGQSYDIDFIGDLASSYTRTVIMDSELEEEALQRHLKWGQEEEFWTYEYNYRSSVASAIHLHARIQCGIPGADKKEEELTEEERSIIETLEHRRWNAYMRSEGYVYSGSKDKASRNDLARQHHDLVDYSSLLEEEKRKDSRVGTKG